MCGIVGIAKRSDHVIKDLIVALKKLEYRGYDSAGIAVLSNGIIHVIKGVGTIDKVINSIGSIKDGNVGIGHTRWATHGGVSKENAHPHVSCNGEVAVVHNGTLDDFDIIRDKLIRKGHRFSSETDTEVIAHLIEEKLAEIGDPVKAFSQAIYELKGSYAIASIIKGYNFILLARNKSPLVIGVGNGENFCASDVAALLHKTNRFIFLKDGEIALITPDRVDIWYLSGRTMKKVENKVEVIDWSPQLLDKGNYEHFMLKEIYEQPYILNKLANGIDYYKKFSDRLLRYSENGGISIVAAGTSYHAGLIGKFLLSKLAGMRSEVIIASEFPEWSHHVNESDTILAISQSGETADVLEAVRIAKSRRAKVLSIVNVPGSTLTRLSDETAFIQAGPEIGVAATKTFLAQVAVLYIISSLISEKPTQRIREDLMDLAKELESSMEHISFTSRKISSLLMDKEHVFFLGRGINYPTALEGALKLKEISYIHAEGYPAGEYKHGPLALIEKGVPSIVLVPSDERAREKIIYNIMEIRSRGAFTITIQPKDVNVPSDFFLPLDVKNELITPIIYAVPLQLIAYYTAVSLGRNPDKPRNLAKSVTVE